MTATRLSLFPVCLLAIGTIWAHDPVGVLEGTITDPNGGTVGGAIARPPYAQDWNLTIQRSPHIDYLLEVCYVGAKGSRLPRNMEKDPAICGPGATSANADRRRIYADCAPNNRPCQLATVAFLTYGSNSTYEAAQLSLSHRYAAGFMFNVSYWFSKTLDYLSSMPIADLASPNFGRILSAGPARLTQLALKVLF